MGRRVYSHALMWLGARGADRRLAAAGLSVATRLAPTAAGDTPIRIIAAAGEPRGLVVDIHGGAWAFGTAAVDDLPNAVFAGAGARVLSIDYRRALPRPIAALQEECADALAWVLADPANNDLPIVLTGESAGAHLAVSALLNLRDRGVALDRVAGVLLHCGVFDLSGTDSAQAAGAETLVLHGPSLEAQIAHLTGIDDAAGRRAPALSPLYADLSGLPPIVLVVGTIDPLRDDSRLLADAIVRAGGAARLEMLADAPHGMIHLPGPYADAVRAAGARWARATLDAARARP